MISTADLAYLRQAIGGELIGPNDLGYDEARRVWNGAINRRPAAIARCVEAADVVAAVRFARERDLLVAVRGGGHDVGGHCLCDDGLVIDLSPMKTNAIDPRRRSARAAAGVLWGELDRATQAFGLATTGGVVTHTGIAGLTLGGGIGWLMRKYGATVDNLLLARLVAADGQVVTASANENADLFWGIRGGGGNFGIVTAFEYQLHPVGPQVVAGPMFYPLDDAPEILRVYRDFVADAPDELTTIFNLRRAPPLPYLPPEVHGRPIVMIGVCYAGPVEDGQALLQPLRAFGSPLVDAIGATPYTTLQALFDPVVPHGQHYYWKSAELPVLTDEAIEVLVEHAALQTSPLSFCIGFQLGGAMSRIAEGETAFSQRDVGYDVNITAVWTADEPKPERHIEWARGFHDALHPLARARVYVNFLGDEGSDRVRAAYGEANFDRLVALKEAWDAANVLRGNHNIKPRATRGMGNGPEPHAPPLLRQGPIGMNPAADRSIWTHNSRAVRACRLHRNDG
jgi:hypothetical protein